VLVALGVEPGEVLVAQLDDVGTGEDAPESRQVGRPVADQAGPRLVVLTRGARGITGFTAAGRIDVDGRPVQVADTIGAGDSVAGAILVALHEHGAELLDDPQQVESMLR
jgi:sugar/nucleoside kinase (ribokinase family)